MHSNNILKTATAASPQRKANKQNELFKQYMVDMYSSEADPAQEEASVHKVPSVEMMWPSKQQQKWNPSSSAEEEATMKLQVLQQLQQKYEQEVENYLCGAPVKRGRGRPRKHVPVVPSEINPRHYVLNPNYIYQGTRQPHPLYSQQQQEIPGAAGPRFLSEDEYHYKCQVCQIIIKRPCEFVRHIKAHDPDLKFECPDCHRHFSRTDALMRHRVYVCEVRRSSRS